LQVIRFGLPAARYILAHFFEPLIPDAVAAIEVKLGTKIGTIPGLRADWDNLVPGTLVEPRSILFAKIRCEPPAAVRRHTVTHSGTHCHAHCHAHCHTHTLPSAEMR
jgi:hypothetical protein